MANLNDGGTKALSFRPPNRNGVVAAQWGCKLSRSTAVARTLDGNLKALMLVSILCFVAIFGAGELLAADTTSVSTRMALKDLLFDGELRSILPAWLVLGFGVPWGGLLLQRRLERGVAEACEATGAPMAADELSATERRLSWLFPLAVLTGAGQMASQFLGDRGDWLIWEAPVLTLPLTFISFALVHLAVALLVSHSADLNRAIQVILESPGIPAKPIGAPFYQTVGYHYWLLTACAIGGLAYLSVTTSARVRADGFEESLVPVGVFILVLFMIVTFAIWLIVLPLNRNYRALQRARGSLGNLHMLQSDYAGGRGDMESVSELLTRHELAEKMYPGGAIPGDQTVLLIALLAVSPTIVTVIRFVWL